jgi:hypothetical protein
MLPLGCLSVDDVIESLEVEHGRSTEFPDEPTEVVAVSPPVRSPHTVRAHTAPIAIYDERTEPLSLDPMLCWRPRRTVRLPARRPKWADGVVPGRHRWRS